MELAVTISRLPDSKIYELDDYIDELNEKYDLDPSQLHVFKSLLQGYDEAWNELERIKGGTQ